MLRPPPRPTLFPYTTLFRSVPERVEAGTTFREGDRVRLSVESPTKGYLYVLDRDVFADGTTGGVMLIYPWAGALKDRKSTRLNSSHRCISYAVFCLKKKKAK